MIKTLLVFIFPNKSVTTQQRQEGTGRVILIVKYDYQDFAPAEFQLEANKSLIFASK